MRVKHFLSYLRRLVLFIPTLLVICIMAFVGYCTLLLVVPWSVSTENKDNIDSSSGEVRVLTQIGNVSLALLFAFFGVLTVVSFLRSVLTSNSVCDNPPLNIDKNVRNNLNSPDLLESLGLGLRDTQGVNTSSDSHSRVYYCQRCVKPNCNGGLKPKRAHHCSVCMSCVLVMDHHCTWTSNCIGFFNRKFFVLFLFYASLSCHVSTLMCVKDLYSELISNHFSVRHYTGRKPGLVMFNSVLTLAFGVTLTFFALFHLWLVARGMTTLEFATHTWSQMYDRDKSKWHNFIQVFGSRPMLWFVPVFTSIGDGYQWQWQWHSETTTTSSSSDSEQRQLIHSTNDSREMNDNDGSSTSSINDIEMNLIGTTNNK